MQELSLFHNPKERLLLAKRTNSFVICHFALVPRMRSHQCLSTDPGLSLTQWKTGQLSSSTYQGLTGNLNVMCGQTHRAGNINSVAIEDAFPDNDSQISKNKRFYSVVSTLFESAATGRTNLSADTSAKHEAGAGASSACGTSTLDDSISDHILAVSQLRPSFTLKLSESAEVEYGSKLLDRPQSHQKRFNSTVLQHRPINSPRQVAIGKFLNGMSLQDNYPVCKLQEGEPERQEYLSLFTLADIQHEDDFQPSLKVVDEELAHINDKAASAPTTAARDNDLLNLMRKSLSKQDSLKTNEREPTQLSKKIKDVAVVDGASGKADPTSNLDISSQIPQSSRNRSGPSPITIPERYSSRQTQHVNNREGGNQDKRPGSSEVEAGYCAFSESEFHAQSGSRRTFLKGTSITQDVQSSPLNATEDHSSKLGTSLDSAPVGHDSVACALYYTAAGEWMYKHFGRGRASSAYWDGIGRIDDTCADNVSPVPRHKRWIWINPSERTISWSRKPLNTGVSLHRHRVRNCTFSPANDLTSRNLTP